MVLPQVALVKTPSNVASQGTGVVDVRSADLAMY
jgi:hypothetical protein